ncbi:MAG: heavy-metal-associated domain-containing protein [Calditrichae bacterium]|nr:heavy-metal-associated domain-containing protein [Calditrichia bacterium]
MLSSCEKSDNSAAQAEVQVVKAEKVNLSVEGMTCGSCVNSIETALAKQNGIIKGKVSLEENACEVEFDASKTNTDEILATIEKAGYSATVVQ